MVFCRLENKADDWLFIKQRSVPHSMIDGMTDNSGDQRSELLSDYYYYSIA